MHFQNEEQLVNNGRTEDIRKNRRDILFLMKKAIKAVDPYHVVSLQVEDSNILVGSDRIAFSDFDHIYLVSFGKASIGMTKAVTDRCDITSGIVITNDMTKQIQHPNIKTFHGDHPIPNQESIDGTRAVEELIAQVTENDLVIVLISGGGSALLCHPRVNLEDMQKTTSLLLKSGATIMELNIVRNHLSFVKGGQLINQVKGMVISFIISDVIGDPLGSIASGPTVGDETTFEDAKQILIRYDLWDKVPQSDKIIINQGLNKEISETPSPSDIDDQRIKNIIVANNTLACNTLVKEAEKLGYHSYLYSTTLQGEAREMVNTLIDILIDENQRNEVDLLVAGGETTVVVRGQGKGGRNQEMVLGILEKLDDHSMVFASCGTDGIDGMSHAAGAIADPFSHERAREHGLDITEFLKDNNSNQFFSQLNDLLITGPTGTNVMDIQVLIKVKGSENTH